MNANNLLIEEADTFQALVEEHFRARGCQLIGYVPMSPGFLLVVCRNESLQLVYGLPGLLPVTSVDIDVCERAIRRYDASGGYVVARSAFLPGAQSRARELRVALIGAAELGAVN
jgi:hypothetical protein